MMRGKHYSSNPETSGNSYLSTSNQSNLVETSSKTHTSASSPLKRRSTYVSVIGIILLVIIVMAAVLFFPSCALKHDPSLSSVRPILATQCYLQITLISPILLLISLFDHSPSTVTATNENNSSIFRLLVQTLQHIHNGAILDEMTNMKGYRMVFHSGGYCIPKANSGHNTGPNGRQCGEDAYLVGSPQFIIHPGHQHQANSGTPPPPDGASSEPITHIPIYTAFPKRTLFGIADGVGGWGISGGDSSRVSQGLLQEISNIVGNPLNINVPLSQVVKEAFTRMAAQEQHEKGSTTLSLAIYTAEKNILDVGNLGDSATFIIRNGKFFYKTKIGQESFNAPYQIGFDMNGHPYGMLEKMTIKTGIRMLPGDIILQVTDGVLDNLFEDEILSLINLLVTPIIPKPSLSSIKLGNDLFGNPIERRISRREFRPHAFRERLNTAAAVIAWNAWARSHERTWLSPFAESAIRSGMQFSGG